jgi:LacI family transcriptional regulator
LATLRDIADQTGVSVQTVSSVLSGKAKQRRISTKLAKRIESVASDLEYRPNAAARAIRRGRFNSLAVLQSSHLGGDIGGAMVHGIRREAVERDMHLVMGELPDEQLTDDDELPRILREWSVDGLLVGYTFDVPSRMVELIRTHHIPSMWMNVKLDADCVHPDDYGATVKATQHLLKLGHERILYLGGTESEHYSAGDRFQGYLDVTKSAGLRPQQLACEVREAPARLTEALQSDDRPTAILAAYQSAIPVAMTAASLGMQLGTDLSLLGVRDPSVGPIIGDADNVFMGRTMTSLKIPAEKTGRVATRQLLKKVDDPETTFEPKALPFEFDPGETCGPPAEH